MLIFLSFPHIIHVAWLGLGPFAYCPWGYGVGCMTASQKKDGKGGGGGGERQLTRTSERKRGSSMTSKQNRGGPASPSHPPRLHRNTRAMPTLQTHSFPLSSATLHYPVLSQAQRGTAPLSPHYSRVPAHSQASRSPRQGIRCPSGIGSLSLYMPSEEKTLGGLHLAF